MLFFTWLNFFTLQKFWNRNGVGVWKGVSGHLSRVSVDHIKREKKFPKQGSIAESVCAPVFWKDKMLKLGLVVVRSPAFVLCKRTALQYFTILQWVCWNLRGCFFGDELMFSTPTFFHCCLHFFGIRIRMIKSWWWWWCFNVQSIRLYSWVQWSTLVLNTAMWSAGML